MQDIRVDADGNFRCWNCGSKNFTRKRTRRAKVIGVAGGVATAGVVGAATPLLVGQRQWCQACGEYSKMGNAQPFTGAAREAKTSAANKPASRTSAKKGDDGSTFIGVVFSVIVMAVLTGVVVTHHAWWWLIALVPIWLFLAVATVGFILDLAKPKASKRATTTYGEPRLTKHSDPTATAAAPPRPAGWYPDRTDPLLERRWSGTAWTSQTRRIGDATDGS